MGSVFKYIFAIHLHSWLSSTDCHCLLYATYWKCKMFAMSKSDLLDPYNPNRLTWSVTFLWKKDHQGYVLYSPSPECPCGSTGMSRLRHSSHMATTAEMAWWPAIALAKAGYCFGEFRHPEKQSGCPVREHRGGFTLTCVCDRRQFLLELSIIALILT